MAHPSLRRGDPSTEGTAPRYRVGLVGAGYISEFHVAALRRIPDVELLGFQDIDGKRAAQAADRFGLRSFPFLADLRAAGADVIHVLTPPRTHAEVALEALELGCHVLVEKPLAVEVLDCERLQVVAAAKGLRVCVNHSLLFDPQIQRARRAVREGRIGQVVSVDILRSSVYPPYAGGPLPPHYCEPGYPFRDLGVHALYLLQAFLGPIEHVQADWVSLGGDPNLAFDEWRAHVRCRNGLGQLQLSWNVKPLQSQVIIQGTHGVLRVDLFLMFQARRLATPLPRFAERVLNAVIDSTQPAIQVPRNITGYLRGKVLPYHGLQSLVGEFYRSLDSGAPVPVSVAEATPVVRWTEEVARAADRDWEEKTGRFGLSESVPVLVTGASGALGQAVVERLRGQGAHMRLFVRRVPSQLPARTEIALGNLGDPLAVDRAVRGADVVIHIGAAMKGSLAEHECATVVGTRNVLEACRKYGVKKLVHISSLSVVDWAGETEGAPISESTPLEPRPEERGAYVRAKLKAERLVSQYVRDHDVPAVILRPGQIFGGRIPLLTPAVARKADGRWLVLGDGRVPLPLVYLDDVVDAALLAAESGLRDGEIIQIVDEALTQNEILRLVLGKDERVTRLPKSALLAGGKLSEVVLGRVGKKSPVATYRLQSALAHCQFEGKNAERLLNWKPRVGVREGIRRVAGAGMDAAAGEKPAE